MKLLSLRSCCDVFTEKLLTRLATINRSPVNTTVIMSNSSVRNKKVAEARASKSGIARRYNIANRIVKAPVFMILPPFVKTTVMVHCTCDMYICEYTIKNTNALHFLWS